MISKQQYRRIESIFIYNDETWTHYDFMVAYKMITLIQAYTNNLRMIENDKHIFTMQTLTSFSNHQDRNAVNANHKYKNAFSSAK